MRALSAIGFILFIQACFVSVDDFPVATSEVGDACDDSNPCPPGLDCWRADADPGAPGGVCTKTCVTPDDCPSGSNCVDIAGKRTCLPACEFGTGESSKCRGRRELGCNEQNSCVPLCSSDAHCPGRYCDRTQGLCVDARNGGSLAPGALCTNAAQCRGDCVPAAGSFKVCQEQCVLGSQGACASDGSDTNLGCVDLLETGAQVGDVGHCARTCNCPDSGCGDGGVGFKCILLGSEHFCIRRLTQLGDC